MAARTPGEAVEEFLDPIKVTLRCITDEGYVARIKRPGGPYPSLFQRGLAVLDRGRGRSPLQLALTHSYLVESGEGGRAPWRLRTASWIYKIADANGVTILEFHWHPANSGRVTWPHIHAYGTHVSLELHKLHPPTGRISIESVVRFLIEDLGVVPRRADWPAILDRNERLFRERRTWS